MVCEVNMEKCVIWCKKQLEKKHSFTDVVWFDKSSVQLDNSIFEERVTQAESSSKTLSESTHMGGHFSLWCNTGCRLHWHHESHQVLLNTGSRPNPLLERSLS